MMMLSTYSVLTENQSASVFWRIGLTRGGCVQLTLDDGVESDKELIAEILAIKYLLYQKRVFDHQIGTGKGFQLNVSKGAIKKCALGKSGKQHVLTHAKYLAGVPEMNIQVSKDDFRNVLEDPQVDVISAEDIIEETRVVETPCLGDVVVLRHAVDRYAQRITDGEPKNPWASLVKRLMHPALQRLTIPENVLTHKERKYGSTKNLELWGHSNSALKLLLINEPEKSRKLLITVFQRGNQ
tara:strand:+ start:390 stop:1109 length:720 start_codon:yes stop_codon:yes gene_type:complete